MNASIFTGNVPKKVRIVEVGPRDGLQNESAQVPTEDKVRFINALADSGLRHIEVTSFVRPDAVPQLADASEVLASIRTRPGVTYSALVPNERGLERAIQAGVREVAVFTAATNEFARHNIHMTVQESLQQFAPLVRRARGEGIAVRGYVSTAFGCPYEGAVAPSQPIEVARRLLEMGVYEVSLGDTIGVATPDQIPQVVSPLLEEYGADRLALHLHDTRGMALANALAGLLIGVHTFDASAGGLGGCPYAPGASGNLATEDLLYMLNGMGMETGVDIERVAEASRFILSVLGRKPTSHYLQSKSASG